MLHRLLLVAACALAGPLQAQPLTYPTTATQTQTDSYFGQSIDDPYRWLEDDQSAATKAWVTAQNQVTDAYLQAIPERARLRERLDQLMNYERYSQPRAQAGQLFYFKNSGLQNQSVLYVQRGETGKAEVLLDPNSWSTDGTSRLAGYSVSKDGKYVAYGISKAGSDWNEWRVMELASRRLLPEVLSWIKFSEPSWQGHGFFYSRYPAPPKGEELTASNANQKVYFHRVGTAPETDRLVHEDSAHPQRSLAVESSEDERLEFLHLIEPGRRGNALFFRKARSNQPFRPIVEAIGNDRYDVIDSDARWVWVRTNQGAPNGRVVRYDLSRWPLAEAQTVVPEREQPLGAISSVGGRLFAVYLRDVVSEVVGMRMDGSQPTTLALPGKGSASGFGGEATARATYYTYTSFNQPPAVYRLDLASGQSRLLFSAKLPNFSPDDYSVDQQFFNSRDGTRVPMFVISRKGLPRDGRNPTLLYGYGGFNISLTPWFSPTRLAWLEQGGVFVVVSLRGGAEYGERWHEGGMRLSKQNVFDDFIGAAQQLIQDGTTSPARLAMEGGSNGGLLVGAVLNQRPELFGAAHAAVGVMDMLRFQKFTAGKHWIAEYGASDASEADFKNLLTYSPLHNIRAGGKYPAVLITTADHDDRVVPAHSFKYAATLQAKAAHERPLLIRIETQSGHGSSNLSKSLDYQADVYAFLFKELGMGFQATAPAR